MGDMSPENSSSGDGQPPEPAPRGRAVAGKRRTPPTPSRRKGAAGADTSAARLGDGTQSPGRGRFVRETPGLSSGADRSGSASPFRLQLPFITPGQLAFSAMQFLPVPLLVLNSLKTVVLANEAMGRLLGLVSDNTREETVSVLERLRGQTLSQVGIDMLQDGRPIWITWEAFLDSVAQDMGPGTMGDSPHNPDTSDGDATPKSRPPAATATHHPSPNVVVDVVVSQKDLSKTLFDARLKSRASEFQSQAKMIISVWEIEDHQTYFTLTFTNSEEVAPTVPQGRRSIARPSVVEAADRKLVATSNPSSIGSSRGSNSSPSFRPSPGMVSTTSAPFPPMGPPSKSSLTAAPSILQKLITMKDALLDNTEMPILAMWKDGSVAFPNAAARKLLAKEGGLDKLENGFDLLPGWNVYTEDFERKLEPREHPISVLIETERPFSGTKIGMYDANGKRHVFDVLGEAVRDDITGEFLAGVVTCRDVTGMTQMITQIKEQDEERFRLICDSMPQLVWTSTPDGYHDFYNSRWYSYTGLTKEESIGLGWKNPFHPEDMPEATRRWRHSLATGAPYVTEYRCKSKEGEWRWFLGRALPLKNKDTGEIFKWFGTCTDVHESIETKLDAKRTREQLLSVLAHSLVTVLTVDRDRRVTMLEGALIWEARPENRATTASGTPWYLGERVDDVFNRLAPDLKEGVRPKFLGTIDDVIEGRISEDIKEHSINSRWYRTRFLPIHGKNDGHREGNNIVDGVIGVIMDVTELKHKEVDLELQAKEKTQLLANEAAAKEASRLKSQFLANTSHEIRTPITGVIGMAELLLDLQLGEEQREYTENIYRSANALLTVINDILDFSKVESGRLDIEEVQFSLSIIVGDVNKMLSFAAERKGLDFRSEMSPSIEHDLVVLGDPGRVRQIITNLLTNSIKFTHQGYLKFSVLKEKETTREFEVRFVIEDTGIGIDEEVLTRLFQPFSQGDASTARKFGGTGLGLTICKNLLDLMNGRISLESAIGAGTTATFWIPFKKVGAQASNVVHIDPISARAAEMSVTTSSEFDSRHGAGSLGHTSSVVERKGGLRRQVSTSARSPMVPEFVLTAEERAKIHILVVEDNHINQVIATQAIKKLGFSVAAVWNGKEALEYITAAQAGRQPKPFCVLLDCQMPVMDGYKCTHILRHHVPYRTFVQDVPIVAMTASAIQGDREKCRRAGMDDYLAKPVKSATLEQMLVRWCHAGRVLPRRRDEPAPSDCSEPAEHCSNADAASTSRGGGGGGDDDDDWVASDSGAEGGEGGQDPSQQRRPADGSGSNAETPRGGGGAEEGPHFPGYGGAALESDQRRGAHERAGERAKQSRDDKLMGAAGARSLSSPLAYTQMTSALGDELSVANMERFGREDERRRQS